MSVMLLSVMLLSVMFLSVMLLSVMLLSVMFLSVMFLSVMLLSVMLLSVMLLNVMLLSVVSKPQKWEVTNPLGAAQKKALFTVLNVHLQNMILFGFKSWNNTASLQSGTYLPYLLA